VFQVCRSTFDSWLADQELPVMVLGQRKFFLPSELLSFLREDKLVLPRGMNRARMSRTCKACQSDAYSGPSEWPLIKRSKFIESGMFKPAFARRLIDNRSIPYIRVGKMVYVDLELLHRFLCEFKTQSPPTLHSLGLL
jgi:hypothetical protein